VTSSTFEEGPATSTFNGLPAEVRDFLTGKVAIMSIEGAPIDAPPDVTSAPAAAPVAPEPYLRDRRPSDPSLLRTMKEACGYAQLHMWDDAVNAIAAVPAVVKDENRFWVFEVWLSLYRSHQKWVEAESMARQFTQTFPHRRSAWEALIEALERQNRLTEAEIERRRGAKVLWELGRIFWNVEDRRDIAEDCIRGSIALDPKLMKTIKKVPHLRALFKNTATRKPGKDL
jgi:hypothetical protein